MLIDVDRRDALASIEFSTCWTFEHSCVLRHDDIRVLPFFARVCSLFAATKTEEIRNGQMYLFVFQAKQGEHARVFIPW